MTHDKYSTWSRQIWYPQNTVPCKNGTNLCSSKIWPKVICRGRLSWLIFKIKCVNLLFDSDSWSWDFKAEFFILQSNISITLMYLIVGVGSISSVLVVLQKTNNAIVRWHFCEIPLSLLGAIFAKWYFW